MLSYLANLPSHRLDSPANKPGFGPGPVLLSPRPEGPIFSTEQLQEGDVLLTAGNWAPTLKWGRQGTCVGPRQSQQSGPRHREPAHTAILAFSRCFQERISMQDVTDAHRVSFGVRWKSAPAPRPAARWPRPLGSCERTHAHFMESPYSRRVCLYHIG